MSRLNWTWERCKQCGHLFRAHWLGNDMCDTCYELNNNHGDNPDE